MITGGENVNAGFVINLGGEIIAKLDNFESPLTTSNLSKNDEILVFGTQAGKLYFYENYIQMLN